MQDHETARIVQLGLIYLIALILSIAVHEFGHAIVADILGDPLPRAQGRVTLNPLAHIDPIGTLLIPAFNIFAGAGLIGWGKPVMTSPRALFLRGKKMTMRTADLLISVAGPGMNIVLAALLSIVYLVLLRAGVQEFDAERSIPLLPAYVANVIQMNVALAFFNLIPCPPLDGRSLLFWFLPYEHPVKRFLNTYGPLIFISLFITGALRVILGPVYTLSGMWLDQLRHWAP